ncbi:aminoglycoside phosphotransferase family protein [Paenibacillus sp. P25]|nr:aminoglycoside phosphotransferase family protein [Paenibacillus sp. P25]
MYPENQEEIVLHGGNVSEVVRIGDTVRRTLKRGSYTIHKLLRHLEAAEFSGAPRYIGQDEKEREVLSFMPGETYSAQYPFIPVELRSDEVLAETARLLRSYHDATVGFAHEPTDNWQMSYPGKEIADVICHNDAAPYNLVYRNGMPRAIIDFDNACPGPRIWDLVYLMYTAIPLTRYTPTQEGEDMVEYDPLLHAGKRKISVETFFNAYGMQRPVDWLDHLIRRLEDLCDTMIKRAASGEVAFQKMISDGHLAHYRKEIEFIRSYGRDWLT